MSTTLALLTMAFLSDVSAGAATDTLPNVDTVRKDSTRALREVPVNIGLAPGHNANGDDPANVRNRFALNLAMNDAGAIDGMDIALGLSRTRTSMRGFQASLGANFVEGDVHGFQASSVNLGLQGVEGVQAAAFVNLAKGRSHGLQASGLVNLATRQLDGAQWAGVFNQAGSISGIQMAPVNLSGNVCGLQLGWVNIAQTVHGAQIGWINVADSVDGAAIGLLSFAKNIDHQADIWLTESGITNVGLTSGTEHFYTILALAMTHPDDVRAAGLTWGLGARLRWSHTWLALDGVATHLLHDLGEWDDNDHHDRRGHDGRMDVEANQLASLRASAGWKMFPRFTVYGGVSGNVLVSSQAPDNEKYLSRNEGPEWNPSSETRVWPGVFFGIRI